MLAFVVLSLVLQLCVADILRPIDYASHVKFPVPIKPRNDGHLVGHLEQLGTQRPASGQVHEYFVTPTPRELWNNNVKVYRPAVLRGALKGSPALTTWTDENLIREYGQEEVLVEKKSEDRKTEPKRMTIEGFLGQYEKHNWYVVTILPDAMRKDVRLPKPLMCSSFQKNLQELNLWIGTNGTRSMLHYDADQIMHCVVTGRKDWILIHPDNTPQLDMVLGMSGQNSGFSHLPVDAIDEKLYPELWDVPWEYVTLYGGDCLYLPSQYFHQVRSFNRSISATMLFYPRDVFSDDDCKDVDLDSYQSLSDVYVYWTYVKGQETVDMGYQNPLKVKNEFINTIKLSGLNHLTEEYCLYLTVLTQGQEFLQNKDNRNWLFGKLDGDKDGIVTDDEILTSDIEIWKQWCRIIENPHGPVRSELTQHERKSNNSAEFLPRNNDYYVDSKNVLIFLKFLLRVKGKKNKLTFANFKKCFQTRHGTAADSFLLIDSNFDGILTLEEIEGLDRKFLRDFSRKYYGIKGTRIVGGGIFEEEVESNEMEYLEELDSIPKKLLLRDGGKMVARQEEEKKEEKRRRKMATEMFERLKSLTIEQPGKKLMKDIFLKKKENLQELFDASINMDIVFHFLDRGDKGYVSMDDLEFYSQSTPITEAEVPVNSENIAVVKKEKVQEPWTPQNFIINLIVFEREIRRELKRREGDEEDEDRERDDEEDVDERSDDKEEKDDRSDGEYGEDKMKKDEL